MSEIIIESSVTISFENVSDYNTEELFVCLHDLFNACGGHMSSINRIDDSSFKMSLTGTHDSLARFRDHIDEVIPGSK